MASPPQNLTLGFVGLGNMGSQMAFNLSVYAEKNSLPPLRLWNRTRSKIEPLAQSSHSTIVSTLPEMATQCDVIHTCLANDEVAFSVYREFFKTSSAAGTIFADHSTLYPATATALEKEAQEAGMTYLSCPVFGPPAAAKGAQLLVVLSGDAKGRELLRSYVVPTIGKAILDAGPQAEKGALMKLLGNNCILGTIELLSESFTLAEKTGFEAGLFYEFIKQWFPAPAWVNYGKKICEGTFSGKTGFKLDGGMKDAAFIRRLGAETSTPTPIIDQAWNHLTTAKAVGGPDLDWSACSAGMRVTAGLKPFKGEDFSLAKADTSTSGVNGEKEHVNGGKANGSENTVNGHT